MSVICSTVMSVMWLSETGVDVGARPFHFEPGRVRHDMQPESNEEDGDSETNRLKNTDW